jgi:hypothetical protein
MAAAIALHLGRIEARARCPLHWGRDRPAAGGALDIGERNCAIRARASDPTRIKAELRRPPAHGERHADPDATRRFWLGNFDRRLLGRGRDLGGHPWWDFRRGRGRPLGRRRRWRWLGLRRHLGRLRRRRLPLGAAHRNLLVLRVGLAREIEIGGEVDNGGDAAAVALADLLQ